MNSELPVCRVLVTFLLLTFDFVPKIEVHSIYNKAWELNEKLVNQKRISINTAVAHFETFFFYSAYKPLSL